MGLFLFIPVLKILILINIIQILNLYLNNLYQVKVNIVQQVDLASQQLILIISYLYIVKYKQLFGNKTRLTIIQKNIVWHEYEYVKESLFIPQERSTHSGIINQWEKNQIKEDY